MRRYKFIGLLLLLCTFKSLQAQYTLPTNFTQVDSASFRSEVRKFSQHISVHFGDVPGFVFQIIKGFPRFQIFYQHNMAYSSLSSQYGIFPESGLTSVGLLSGVGDITPNLQVILRYSPMVMDGVSAVLNGYGVRFRSSAGTDTLHSLALGLLIQKTGGSNLSGIHTLDFSTQYGYYLHGVVLLFDLTGSFISGNMTGTGTISGERFDYAYEERIIHTGIGLLKRWKHLNLGIKLRTNGSIWNSIITIGWSIPLSN